MKRNSLFAMLAAALMIVAVSCKKESVNEPTRAPEADEFCAEIAGGGVQSAAPSTAGGGMTTKAKFDGLSVKWEGSDDYRDVIHVQGTDKSTHELESVWTDFSCNVTTGESSSRAYFSGNNGQSFQREDYHAFYSSSVVPVSGSTGTFNAIQMFDPDHPAAHLPMYAYSTNHWLTFHNVCAVLKITVPKTSRYFVISNSSQLMNGQFNVVGDVATMTKTSGIVDADRKVTVRRINNDDDFSFMDVVYVAVPAGTYNNLCITFYNGSGASVYTTGNSTTSRAFDANKIYNVKMPANIFLPGVFTVNESGKQVRFTSGNVYCVKSAAGNIGTYTFKIENTQDNFTTSAYDYTHVDHFYWANSNYLCTYSEKVASGDQTNDFIFKENKNFKIDGISLYCLSKNEWLYILSDNTRQRGIRTISGNKWFIIAPDNLKSVTIPSDYSLQQYTNEGYLCFNLSNSKIYNQDKSFFHNRVGFNNIDEMHLYTGTKEKDAQGNWKAATGLYLYEDADGNPQYYCGEGIFAAETQTNDNHYARYVRLVQTVVP